MPRGRYDVRDKVVLVNGASRGTGAEAAEADAAEASRDEQALA